MKKRKLAEDIKAALPHLKGCRMKKESGPLCAWPRARPKITVGTRDNTTDWTQYAKSTFQQSVCPKLTWLLQDAVKFLLLEVKPSIV